MSTCIIVQCSSVPWPLWLEWTQPAAESRKKLHELPYHPFYIIISASIITIVIFSKGVSFKIADAASLKIRVV